MTSETTSPRPFTSEVPLRWGDMDTFGHVNNVQYHRLLEEARVRTFAQWFGTTGAEDLLTSGVLLARQEIEFLDQLSHRLEPVAVVMWTTHVGGASWDLAYEVRDPDGVGEALYARAESTLVAFDLEAQRPRKLTGGEREALEAHRGEPVPMRRRR